MSRRTQLIVCITLPDGAQAPDMLKAIRESLIQLSRVFEAKRQAARRTQDIQTNLQNGEICAALMTTIDEALAGPKK